MAKIQFNCRLNEATVEAINAERDRMAVEEGRAVSQADVLERLVPSLSFTRFRDILEPVVYGWRRGEQYLYIGYSKNGLRRACEREHHVIGKVEAVGDHDVLDLWVCKTTVEARHLEREMIRQYQPDYNRAIPADTDGEMSTKLTNFRLRYDAVDILERLAARWKCNLTEALTRAVLIAETTLNQASELNEAKTTPPRPSGRAESVAQRRAREAKEHAAKLAETDVLARMTGRDDIEYDLENTPRGSALHVALQKPAPVKHHYEVQEREAKPLGRPHGGTEAKRRREQG